MRGAHDARHRPQRRRRVQDALSQDRVLVHELPLAGSERTALVEQRSRYAHFADVVELGRAGDLVELVAAQAEPPLKRLGKLSDFAGVALEVWMLRAKCT